MTDGMSTFSWGPARLRLDFVLDAHRRVRVAGLPLVEVLVAGYGRWAATERAIGTVFGERMTYQGHEESRADGWLSLRVDLADPDTGLTSQVHLRSPEGVAAIQSRVRLANRGERSLVLESVTSLVLGGIADGDGGVAGLDVWHADNEWLAEGRWQRRALREVLVDMNFGGRRQQARSSFFRASQGTWSTGRHLPAGALTADLPASVSFWPLGLPGWTDPWIALGLRGGRRPMWLCGVVPARIPDRAHAPVPHLEGREANVGSCSRMTRRL